MVPGKSNRAPVAAAAAAVVGENESSWERHSTTAGLTGRYVGVSLSPMMSRK